MQKNVFGTLEYMYNVLSEAEKLYGKYSLGTVFIKYQILATSLELKINNSDKTLKLENEVIKATKLLQEHYQISNRKQLSHDRQYMWAKKINYQGREVLKYNQEKYTERYSLSGKEIQDKIFVLSDEVESKIIPNKVYMYAINADLEPIIYLQPIPFQDLLFGRQRLKVNNGRIAHPVLLDSHGLMAVGAGEVIFVKDKISDNIKGLIINNKSGHYRPSGDSLEKVKEAFSNNLGLVPENIICIEVEKDWGKNEIV